MLLGIGGLMFSTADAQQIYKWVDQQGVTHYSEQAPAGNHAKTISYPFPSGRDAPFAAPGT